MFKPGQGGRKAGSKNKVKSIEEALEELGVDPLARWVEAVEQLPPKLQADHYREMTKFVRPQLKAIEVTADVHNSGVPQQLVSVYLPSNGRELNAHVVEAPVIQPAKPEETPLETQAPPYIQPTFNRNSSEEQ